MTDIIQWIATAATVTAALVTASNLGPRITGAGFGIFLIGSLAWATTAILTDQSALLWTNALLTLLNIFGMWRWLGRQAGVEQGGKQAARESQQSPGDTLVPVSLFTRAKVAINGEDKGSCVDAMADARSGELRYLVITDGGVAGVGETFRRLDWADAELEGETVQASMPGGAESLPAINRDQWPSQ